MISHLATSIGKKVAAMECFGRFDLYFDSLYSV